MKQFFKYVAATIVGLLLFGLLMTVMFIGTVGSLAAMSDSKGEVKKNSVLVLNLSGTTTEQAEENVFAALMGESTSAKGLNDILSAIKKAEEQKDIKGIYLETGAFAPDSWASLSAIRHQLSQFRKSGKWIIAYGDAYTQSAYYLASVADKVYLNPQGMIDLHGLAAQPLYVKDMLQKFGVRMQVAKVGAYKSATEMFTGDRMSEANREQVTAYITQIWNTAVKDIADSRKISQDSVNAWADRYAALSDPKDYVQAKLVDGLLYTDQIKPEIRKRLGIGKDDDICSLRLEDMKSIRKKDALKGDKIAVYYAYGSIVDGAASNPMSQEHVIDAQVVCKDLEKLAENDKIKAVVLRINSGGGSAYASEQIWHQVAELKKQKPVVVSMGGMTASGGYYIACNADYIYAEPLTLTGSIGIFGMFPDFSGLITDKLGVKFDEVKTNKHSGMGTLSRPFNEEEMALLNKYIERGYSLFRQRVADGRKLTVEQVEEIAQGHVWTGQDGKRIRLVDELGSLDDAIAKAARLAKVEKYHPVSYPAPASWTDQLISKVSGNNYLDERLKALTGDYYECFSLLKTLDRQNCIQARVPFYISIR